MDGKLRESIEASVKTAVAEPDPALSRAMLRHALELAFLRDNAAKGSLEPWAYKRKSTLR